MAIPGDPHPPAWYPPPEGAGAPSSPRHHPQPGDLVRIHADRGLGIRLPGGDLLMLDGVVVKILDEKVERFRGNVSRSWIIQPHPWNYAPGVWPWAWQLSDRYRLERV